MAEYRDLGSTLAVTGVPGGSDNPYGAGNWTVTFTPVELNSKVGQAELYQANVSGTDGIGPVGSSFQLFRNKRLWNTVFQGWANNYDPVNPMYIRKDDTVFFYWNVSVAPAPVVVCWLRYDLILPENRGFTG